jgi:hydrogenase expression/formation protein HypC
LSRRINIEMLPGVRPGDYVLVHAGFAIEKVDPKKAEETLRLTQPLLIAQKEYKSGGAG